MRAVRIAESAHEDIERQLEAEKARDFKRNDLRPILDALGQRHDLWEEASVAHGPARRLTAYGKTVAGFHLFGISDTEDPRDDALVIYFVDIWTEEFPD